MNITQRIFELLEENKSFMSINECKKVSLKVMEYYHQSGVEQYQKYAERILNCSPFIDYGIDVKREPGKLAEIISHVNNARWCRVRHCPVCQKARTGKWRAKMFKSIPALMEQYPRYNFIFLTLTVRNCYLDELRQTINQMSLAWKRMLNTKTFPAVGYMRTLEVTGPKVLDEQVAAHPHFHCLLMVEPDYFRSNYLTQSQWVEMWQRSLRVDYAPVVDVRKVKAQAEVGQAGADVTQQQVGFVKSVLEVCKYSVKTADLAVSADWLLGITEQLHKLRAINVGGEIAKVISQEDVNSIDDLGSLGDEIVQGVIQLKVIWDFQKGRYVPDDSCENPDCADFLSELL